MISTRSRFALVIALAAVLLFANLAISQAAPKVGSKAPAFKLTSVDDKTITLDQLRRDPNKKNAQRVVLIDFWATWCPYCVQELPAMQGLSDKYQKQGLAVVGIALDTDGLKAVKPFVKDHKLTYTNLVDPNSTTARAYGVRPIPALFLVDKKGIIRYTHIGYTPENIIEKEIKSLLK